MSANEWRCTICQRDMQISNRVAHIAGKSHREAVLCSNLTLATSQASNPTDGTHTAPGWECETCHRFMQVKDKETHLAGKLHQKALRGPMMTGGSAARKKTGKSKTRQPKHGRAKKSDDGDYSDYLSKEEASSLLHEIDTAFGLLPGGGAYKESNFYYQDTSTA